MASVHGTLHSRPKPSPTASYVDSGLASSSSIATSKDPASLPLPPKLSKALEVYEQAVLHEQRSELDEALRLYRQAFRMDENVAKVYERLDYHARVRTEGLPKPAPPPQSSGHVLGHSKQKSDSELTAAVQAFEKLDLGKTSASFGVATGILAHLVAEWPSNLTFDPEEETEPVHVRVLPDELLVHILQFLDVAALERFATVNRKARILTLDSAIWRCVNMTIPICPACRLFYLLYRERVEVTYKAPQIAEDEDIGQLLSQHMQDYRRLYIEHPRVRLDGVYIAVCHYMCVVDPCDILFVLPISDSIATPDVKDTVRARGLT